MPNANSNKRPIDWAQIEADYVTGAESTRALARRYGITEVSIRRRAKKYGWTRDPAGRLAAIRSQLSQAAAQDAPRASPAEVAARLAAEASRDADDLAAGLRVARTVLRRLETLTEDAGSAQDLRTVALAADSAVNTILKIRQVLAPAGTPAIIIERSYGLTPTESHPPSDDF
jgi:hypothetical protein